jgi:hypothetical protein
MSGFGGQSKRRRGRDFEEFPALVDDLMRRFPKRSRMQNIKIQRKHYKWARIQVRAAKDEVARWKAAIAAEETEPEREPEVDAKAASKATRRKSATLEVERLTLTPVLPTRTDRITPVGGDENDAGPSAQAT